MPTRTLTMLSIGIVVITIALVLVFTTPTDERVWQVLGEPLSTSR